MTKGPGKTFKSAVGPFYYILMVFMFIFTGLMTLPALERTNTIELIVIAVSVLPVYILFPWILRTTEYTVYADEMVARCGPFKFHVKKDSIHSIKPTRNPMSGPALSMDRLAIFYDAGRTIMVSPENKAGFYRAMGFEQPEQYKK